MTMGEVDVFLTFYPQLPDDDRDEFLRLLRAVNAHDFEVTEREGQTCLHFDHADENAALVRTQNLVRGLCDGTSIDAGPITQSLEVGWSGP
jgi:hypothetical protein